MPLFSSDYLIQSLKQKALIYNYGSASRHSRRSPKKETVTKIHEQPTNKDLTILEKELIAILANIPTTIGGGNNGHAGTLMDPVRYQLTAGVLLTNPINPGNYPTNVTGNAAAGVRARAEAEHKEEVKEMRLSKTLYRQQKTLSWRQLIMSTCSKLKMTFSVS